VHIEQKLVVKSIFIEKNLGEIKTNIVPNLRIDLCGVITELISGRTTRERFPAKVVSVNFWRKSC
jgi:hypothetical protein